jgi:glycine cleavage system H lipoate-binding protein
MSFPANFDISYYRGDRYELILNPKNANGTVFDLTGYNSSFVVSTTRGSASAAVVTFTPTIDVNAGSITAVIDPTNGRNFLTTGPYVYDIEISRSSSAVYTLVTGTISVTQDVTNTGGS